MVWYSHLFQNFPQFIVIHTVKGFGIVNKAEIDVFLFLHSQAKQFYHLLDLKMPTHQCTTNREFSLLFVAFNKPDREELLYVQGRGTS